MIQVGFGGLSQPPKGCPVPGTWSQKPIETLLPLPYWAAFQGMKSVHESLAALLSLMVDLLPGKSAAHLSSAIGSHPALGIASARWKVCITIWCLVFGPCCCSFRFDVVCFYTPQDIDPAKRLNRSNSHSNLQPDGLQFQFTASPVAQKGNEPPSEPLCPLVEFKPLSDPHHDHNPLPAVPSDAYFFPGLSWVSEHRRRRDISGG